MLASIVEMGYSSSFVLVLHTESFLLCGSPPEHNGVVFLGFGMPQFIRLLGNR